MTNVENKNGLTFLPASHFVLRVPSLPIEDFWKDIDFPVHGGLPSHSQLQTALFLASPTLFTDLEQGARTTARAAANERKVRSYHTRMCTRTTPFGTFAGVALGSWGSESLTRVTPVEFVQSRFDGLWMHHYVAHLEEKLRNRLTYYWNELAQVHGWRIELSNQSATDHNNSSKTNWVMMSTQIVEIAKAAQNGCSWPDLIAIAQRGQSTPNAGDRLIMSLYKRRFLISELNHNPIEDHASRIQRVLQEKGPPELLASFTELLTRIESWYSGDCNEQLKNVRELALEAKQHCPSYQGSVVQADARAATVGCSLPSEIGTQFASAAEAMFELSAFPSGLADFQEYSKRFLERYGPDVEVSLLELVDPVRGLGMPTSKQRGDLLNARDEILLEMATEALRTNQIQLRLTDDLRKRISEALPTPLQIPSSLELLGRIGAKSVSDLNSGKYSIVISFSIGGSSAGKHIGRFGAQFSKEAKNLFRAIAQAELLNDPCTLSVEAIYPTKFAQHDNVLTRRFHRPFALTLGVPPCRSIPFDIHPRDVVIGVDAHGLYAKWGSRNVKIRAVGWHMYNWELAPNPIKFLLQLGGKDFPLLTVVDWGRASSLPRTPRLEYGKVVLCPAIWRISSQSNLFRLRNQEPDWDVAFQEWCEHWGVPDCVYLGDDENRLAVRCHTQKGRQEIRAQLGELRPGTSLKIVEMLPTPEDTWLPGSGGHYVCEIVTPLLRIHSGKFGTVNVAKPRVNATTALEKPLGSDWLYVEAFAPEGNQEALVAGPILRFSEEMRECGNVKRWFFIRYDMGSPHVRWRLNGDAGTLMSKVLPRLSEHLQRLCSAGWISRFHYQTYRPEVVRYGGAALIQHVEDLFCLDSVWIANLFDWLVRNETEIERPALTAWSLHILATSIGIANSAATSMPPFIETSHDSGELFRSEKHWLRAAVAKSSPPWPDAVLHSAFRSYLSGLRETVRRINTLPLVKPHGKGIHDLADDLLHMHSIRMLGPNRAAEAIARSLLARVHRSLSRSPIGIEIDATSGNRT